MNFIQVGLGSYSEYSYLASRDRTCYERGVSGMYRLPPPLRVADEWRGVLVEAHPMAFCQAFQAVQVRMPDAMKRLTWVLGALWAEEVGAMGFEINENLHLHHGWSKPSEFLDGYIPHHPKQAEGVPTLDIQVASLSVEELIQKYGNPDYVILDCEGAEVRLLEAFLRLAPKCVGYHIEAHSSDDAEIVNRLFDNYGYHVVNSVTMQNDRTEMQATRGVLRAGNPLSAMDTLIPV